MNIKNSRRKVKAWSKYVRKYEEYHRRELLQQMVNEQEKFQYITYWTRN